MAFKAKVTRHDWQPGEKERHSTANDIRSLETSLAVLRRRNPPVGKRGAFGSARELAEIERLDTLLTQRKADLAALEARYG